MYDLNMVLYSYHSCDKVGVRPLKHRPDCMDPSDWSIMSSNFDQRFADIVAPLEQEARDNERRIIEQMEADFAEQDRQELQLQRIAALKLALKGYLTVLLGIVVTTLVMLTAISASQHGWQTVAIALLFAAMLPIIVSAVVAERIGGNS